MSSLTMKRVLGECLLLSLCITHISFKRHLLCWLHDNTQRMLGIPSEMAYGEAGTPDGRIPGGAALFFKIQLIEVLSAGIGGGPKLVGADGRELKANKASSGLLGADGKPL